ncbi:hypothetical protein Csa_013246 [Cucumis sativus]|nr:hypothetical protein Csa_013246 [Cucumis sativus]
MSSKSHAYQQLPHKLIDNGPHKISFNTSQSIQTFNGRRINFRGERDFHEPEIHVSNYTPKTVDKQGTELKCSNLFPHYDTKYELRFEFWKLLSKFL